jgi:hypothetical protein
MSSASDPIDWRGDLDDDCTALWTGLMLRAEKMDHHDWWWAVTQDDGSHAGIGSSNEDGKPCQSGEIARQRAETCAREFLGNPVDGNR